MAKSRVAPLKPVTIPRLELTAALVSVRVNSLLQCELEYAEATHVFWTDSRVVLGYISNESKRFHVFVANRVQQIRESTSPSQWNYVDTKTNPADIASRGATPEELVNSDWFSGPDFLWQPEVVVQGCDSHTYTVQSNDPEVKKVQCLSANLSIIEQKSILERLECFSYWNRARRAIPGCLSFKTLLLQCLVKRPKTPSDFPKISNYRPSSVEELRKAEIEILRLVQRECFAEEIKVLSQRSASVQVSKASTIHRLSPFLDENDLIRAGGRMPSSPADFAERHPIILPRKGHITRLLISHCHERVKHQGRGMTTNELRSNGYWILGCSSVVSDIIYHCVGCRKLRGKTQDQKMADLPFDRVDPAPPFSYCGVDCFGPF